MLRNPALPLGNVERERHMPLTTPPKASLTHPSNNRCSHQARPVHTAIHLFTNQYPKLSFLGRPQMPKTFFSRPITLAWLATHAGECLACENFLFLGGSSKRMHSAENLAFWLDTKPDYPKRRKKRQRRSSFTRRPRFYRWRPRPWQPARSAFAIHNATREPSYCVVS